MSLFLALAALTALGIAAYAIASAVPFLVHPRVVNTEGRPQIPGGHLQSAPTIMDALSDRVECALPASRLPDGCLNETLPRDGDLGESGKPEHAESAKTK